MKCKDMKQISEALRFEKEQKKETIQSIIYYTLFDDSKNKMDINYVKKLRKEEVKKVIDNKKGTFKFKCNNENKIECNINYPLCIEECNISSPIELSLKHEKGYDIQNDNESNKENNNINNEEDDETLLKDIIVERRKHFCQNHK